jgi:hypothetical protein
MNEQVCVTLKNNKEYEVAFCYFLDIRKHKNLGSQKYE